MVSQKVHFQKYLQLVHLLEKLFHSYKKTQENQLVLLQGQIVKSLRFQNILIITALIIRRHPLRQLQKKQEMKL